MLATYTNGGISGKNLANIGYGTERTLLPNANYLVRKLVSLFQRHVGKVYYREYLKLSKLEEKEIEKWMLPVAAARLREWIPDSEKKALLAFISNKIESNYISI